MNLKPCGKYWIFSHDGHHLHEILVTISSTFTLCLSEFQVVNVPNPTHQSLSDWQEHTSADGRR